MPYITAAMARYMRKMQNGKSTAGGARNGAGASNGSTISSNTTSKVQRSLKIRVTPSFVDADPTEGVKRAWRFGKNDNLTFDQKRLLYMKNLLNKQVQRIKNSQSFASTCDKQFGNFVFTIEEENIVDRDVYSVSYKVNHKIYPNLPMCVKVYNPNQVAEIANEVYFKALRHLGKKHPYLQQIWQVYMDEGQRVMVMLQLASGGNLGHFIQASGPVDEDRACLWARQLAMALDYMGDMGLCHRAVSPCSVMLCPALTIRLGNFYETMIYWNEVFEDTIYLPCKPIALKSKELPDFQAPEIYTVKGNEVFEPIGADIWSFGCVIYFSLTINYPYHFSKEDANVEEEIQENVKKLPLSPEGIEFHSSLLTSNALTRIHFDKIEKLAWFARLK